MNEITVVVLAVVIAALLGGVAYFGLRGGARPKQKDEAETPRREPAFHKPGADGEGARQTGAPAAGDAEDENAPQRELPIDFTPPELPPPDESQLTTDVCYIISFYAAKALPAAAFQPLTKKLAAGRVAVFRLLAYDEEGKKWKQSEKDASPYWLMAVPLADRGGQLTRDKIKWLEEETRRFCEQAQCRAVFPALGQSLENAGLLDTFCNTVDMLLEMRLVCPPAVSPSRISEALAAQRISPVGANKHVYRLDSEEQFQVMYAPLAGEQSQVLTFLLDAPRVTSPERAFDNMMRCAQRLVHILDAAFIDPRGEAIDDERVAEIRRQLMILHQQMNDYGVPPGGAIAHVLFS